MRTVSRSTEARETRAKRSTANAVFYARCMRRAALAVLSLPACVFEYQNSLLCSLSASRLHVTCFPDVTMCPLRQGAASCVSCRHGCVTGALHAVCPCSVSCPLTFLPPNLPLHVLHGCPPGSTSVLALCPPHEWPIEWPEVADGCGGSDRDVKVHLRLPAEGRRLRAARIRDRAVVGIHDVQ